MIDKPEKKRPLPATNSTPKPGDFPIGSAESRAAARMLATSREDTRKRVQIVTNVAVFTWCGDSHQRDGSPVFPIRAAALGLRKNLPAVSSELRPSPALRRAAILSTLHYSGASASVMEQLRRLGFDIWWPMLS